MQFAVVAAVGVAAVAVADTFAASTAVGAASVFELVFEMPRASVAALQAAAGVPETISFRVPPGGVHRPFHAARAAACLEHASAKISIAALVPDLGFETSFVHF